MDRIRKQRTRRDKKGRKLPKVPIHTYRWEDIRRAKRRGGYPWTHLYKPPFTELIDPEQFTMEGLRRSKSVSTVEVTNVDRSIEIASVHSRSGSVIDKMPAESTESSDNISQYLDKDEIPSKSKYVRGEEKNEELQRANSEEIIPRKRKLSAESSRSKYSLSQLGVMKKIHDARSKIKIPKFNFPGMKTGEKKSEKKVSPPKEVIKKGKRTPESRLKKDENPVYIHIPLKPPSGETDEFSHLEFENPQNETIKSKEKENDNKNSPLPSTKKPLVINPVFKQLLKDVRQLKQKEEAGKSNETNEPSKPSIETQELQLSMTNEAVQNETEMKPVGDDKKVHSIEEQAAEKAELTITEIEENQVSSEKENSKTVIQETLPFGEEELDLEEQQEILNTDEPAPKEDIFDNLFRNRSHTTSTVVITTTPDTISSSSRAVRSRSAEPQHPLKRRSSLESSYSQKSLAGIMKKLKQTSGQIKKVFSMGNLKKPANETKSKQEEKDKPKKPKLTSVVKTGQFDKALKPVQPVYIHIPLKPPEGQTDEFSYLEFECEPTTSSSGTHPIGGGNNTDDSNWNSQIKNREERIDSLDSTTTPPNNDIQFIFLTPPSDDEILDEHEPETPSSEDIAFFSQMKKLAKQVVDEISPDTERSALETVREEDNGNEEKPVKQKEMTSDEEQKSPVSSTADQIEVFEEINRDDKMVVDIEDGLNEPTKSEELKSAIKNVSPGVIKKKVSFKRKSGGKKQSRVDDIEDDDNDGAYEPIEVPADEREVLEDVAQEDEQIKSNEKKEFTAGQSLSMEEEQKSYLDQKLMKDTSLEEDYKKWSKSEDHEYEPVCPPDQDELVTMTFSTPGVIEVENDEPRFVMNADEILKKPVETKKKSIFYFGKRQKDHDESSQRSSSESRSLNSQNVEGGANKATGGNFQATLKEKSNRLKSKTHDFYDKMCNIKKPNIQTPQFKCPEFSKRIKVKKPKFNLPKIPDTATFHLPSFTNTKKTRRRVIDKETRQMSTESNAGDSDTCLEPPRRKSSTLFDFTALANTFPRLKKNKKEQTQAKQNIVSSSTVPRTKKTVIQETTVTRIPLHSENSMENDDKENKLQSTAVCEDAGYDYNKQDTEEESSRKRFGKSIVIDDDYEKENQAINQADYLSRWQHGNFSHTQQHPNEDEQIVEDLVEERFKKISPNYFQHQNEILEEQLRRNENRHTKEIVTDLDNLDEDEDVPEEGEEEEVTGHSSEGSYNLYHKGRLGKIDINSDEFFVVHEIQEGFQTPANALAQMNEYDLLGSQRSLSEVPVKRKPIKKPKRKKTPHGSQEHIHKDNGYTPGPMELSQTPPAIPPLPPSRPKRRSKKGRNRLRDNDFVPYQEIMYMDQDTPRGTRLNLPRESLGILGDDEQDDQDFDYHNIPKEEPSVPPRTRSLKKLNQSDNESILTQETPVKNSYNTRRYMNSSNQVESSFPKRPNRRSSHSLTSSVSRTSLPPSQRDVDSLIADESYLTDNQPVPDYLMENENQPCIEEPCIQDIRDYMGYAVVDKNKPSRDPPLPPKRHKRQIGSSEKFATVPRCHTDLSSTSSFPKSTQQPSRPLRNYSTIGHSTRDHTVRENLYENDRENKENDEPPDTDISQYIEIERDLISGEVVQKMRERPLPPPPRPPRTSRKSLQDITSKENIQTKRSSDLQFKPRQLLHEEEIEVSTQTEPLVTEFVCEKIRYDPNNTILSANSNEQVVKDAPLERRIELITPTTYSESYQETVTHGALLVEPLDHDAKFFPQKVSKERLVPITRESADDDVPEKSHSIIKANKLEISDLDVDRLQVNELLANKIVVSEIESSTIQVDELNAKSGQLQGSNIVLPPNLIEDIVKKLYASENQENVKKKTPTNKSLSVDINSDSIDVDDQMLESPGSVAPSPPEPPPRTYTLNQEETEKKSKSPPPSPPQQTEMIDLEIDEQLPPRPPQPAEQLYMLSQPPASFYALRAKQYIDEMNNDIPTAPERKKYHRKSRSRPIRRSRSNSDDSSVEPLHSSRSLHSRSHYDDTSIPELTGKLFVACSTRTHSAIQRLIYNLTENVLRNADGKQDLHVFTIILLVLIIGLILLSFGEEKTIIHLHHWDFFNPPKNL